jgi:hypothetical protein
MQAPSDSFVGYLGGGAPYESRTDLRVSQRFVCLLSAAVAVLLAAEVATLVRSTLLALTAPYARSRFTDMHLCYLNPARSGLHCICHTSLASRDVHNHVGTHSHVLLIVVL